MPQRLGKQDGRFAIGVDYGTNSVRALVVDRGRRPRGRHRASTTIPAARRASCSIRRIRTSPGRTRPTTSRASIAVGARGREGGEARPRLPAGERRRHRRRHDRLDAHSRSIAQGTPLAMQPEFRKQPGGPGLAVEGPHGPRRGGRDHREGRQATATATWPSAAAPTAASGTGRRSCTASGRRRRSSTAAYSWVELADFVPAFITGNLDPDTLPRGICAAGHKAMYNEQWGGLPSKAFLREARSRRWPRLRERYATPALPADQKAGELTAEVAKQGRPAGRACRWPSARSTPTWARSARASSRARW